MAVRDFFVLKRTLCQSALIPRDYDDDVPDLGVSARVQHLAALLTPETLRMPVMTQRLPPLSKVDWLPTLATRPHPDGIV